MNVFTLFGAALALCVYIPLSVQIVRGKDIQNLGTWFLWGALNAIAAASIFFQHGNFWQPAIFTVGCALIVLSILKTRTFKWKTLETITAAMVIVCLLVWYVADDKTATITTTIAVILAGLPQMWDLWKRPWESALWVWIIPTVSNFVSVAAGKEWSIPERFYPVVCGGGGVVLVLLNSRKYLIQKPIKA